MTCANRSWNSNSSIVLDLEGYWCIIPLFVNTVALLKCHFVFPWVTWFSQYFFPLMSEFHGPKCQKGIKRLKRSNFQKFSGEACPQTPLNDDGLKPIAWVLQTRVEVSLGVNSRGVLPSSLFEALILARLSQYWTTWFNDKLFSQAVTRSFMAD